ncbi:hypothetical protein [Methylobacterium dankookense]|uniref:Uncharacterized protein n=1 Tax=Methylobacterium dankookense TaxID=560405 RepID=A0A564G7V5_9HYPH|nr:hypothetical protein [Methylobacterium dankookense]GJD59271.1 hypothetical protein IFDJLNFL_5199 [Methylobacterium dankookense]VUF15621.1 hypothetical protein MTDSW087_05365 [Methylobacterium dankookense]
MGDTVTFRVRWAALAAYDPEFKAAVDRKAVLGLAAVERFRLAYINMQTKEAVPLLVADLGAPWAAGNCFDSMYERIERLEVLHCRGRMSESDHTDQIQRLCDERLRRLWIGL